MIHLIVQLSMELTFMLTIQQLYALKPAHRVLIPGEKIRLGDVKLPAQQDLSSTKQEFVLIYVHQV